MINSLSLNAQAILLLTAPLAVGRGAPASALLTLGEYKKLARLLLDMGKQPGDLIGDGSVVVLERCALAFERGRLQALLERGFLLSQALERWRSRNIWVVSRADPEYPRQIKARLKEDAPPVFYGCGDLSLLDCGGLAVVGSRHVDEELALYTEKTGELAASAGLNIVSGAAKGIDRSAMKGALSSGGCVIGIMADSLERAALASDNRVYFRDGKLVLISPYDPAAGFNVGNAMQRNKLIYALADAALVVSSDFNSGGTWAGAIEQLEKLHYVTLFVRQGAGKGNAALIQAGAFPWPDPKDKDSLARVLEGNANVSPQLTAQKSFSFTPVETRQTPEIAQTIHVKEEALPASSGVSVSIPVKEQELHIDGSLAMSLLDAVGVILSKKLAQPATDVEVSLWLSVSKTQAKEWLEQLVSKGVLEKLKKPTRYQSSSVIGKLL
jgi:predicted Rossmann fold nucleotide-binding protein DprA/Smf involved in DNA uptake